MALENLCSKQEKLPINDKLNFYTLSLRGDNIQPFCNKFLAKNLAMA